MEDACLGNGFDRGPIVAINMIQFHLRVKTHGLNMINSGRAYYYYAYHVLDNTDLQIMVDCSAIEMECYKFSKALVLDSYHRCTVQLSSQCALVTRSNQWSTISQPSAMCLTLVPGVPILQNQQLTWDPGEKILDSVQLAVQVPWDPGGSTGNRLEDRLKLMEGGLSATILWAGPIRLDLAQKMDGLQLQRAHGCPRKRRLGRKASAWLAISLSVACSYSSVSILPLLLPHVIHKL